MDKYKHEEYCDKPRSLWQSNRRPLDSQVQTELSRKPVVIDSDSYNEDDDIVGLYDKDANLRTVSIAKDTKSGNEARTNNLSKLKKCTQCDEQF